MASKRAKRQFHCQRCGQPCDIYKKGKAHRVLVCPECGVIATNPNVLKSAIKRVARGALGEVPGASAVMEAVGFVSDITKGDARKATPSSPRVARNSFTSEERVALALR